MGDGETRGEDRERREEEKTGGRGEWGKAQGTKPERKKTATDEQSVERSVDCDRASEPICLYS